MAGRLIIPRGGGGGGEIERREIGCGAGWDGGGSWDEDAESRRRKVSEPLYLLRGSNGLVTSKPWRGKDYY